MSIKIKFVISVLSLYAGLRLGLFLLYGGQAAIAHALNMIFNICIFIVVFVFYIVLYSLIRRKLTNKILVVFIALTFANILAYFTMEDFHKIFKTFSFGYHFPNQSIWESIKSTYSEGFNYIAWTTSIIYLLFKDLKNDILNH